MDHLWVPCQYFSDRLKAFSVAAAKGVAEHPDAKPLTIWHNFYKRAGGLVCRLTPPWATCEKPYSQRPIIVFLVKALEPGPKWTGNDSFAPGHDQARQEKKAGQHGPASHGQQSQVRTTWYSAHSQQDQVGISPGRNESEIRICRAPAEYSEGPEPESERAFNKTSYNITTDYQPEGRAQR
jgi:hypothetical protein